jgi:SAM-dependent methyltransferase
MNDAYGVLARYYDKLITGYNYPDIIEYIITSTSGGKGIDLATGTGRIAIALAERGYNMTGADVSTEMLTRAMEAASKKGVKIPFVKMDISKPELKSDYDLVTCCCDGINYIPQSKLDNSFKAIGERIKSGGIFIFDYSTPYKLNEIIGENVFYEDLQELTYLWTNKKIEGGIAMRLTFFTRAGKGYLREDEEHTQYIHTADDIESALINAGFEVKETLDAFTLMDVHSKSERILYKGVKK